MKNLSRTPFFSYRYRQQIFYILTFVFLTDRVISVFTQNEELFTSVKGMFLGFVRSKWLVFFLALCLGYVVIAHMIPEMVTHWGESKRQELLDFYKLEMRQVKYRISCELDVYAENPNEGMFILMKHPDREHIQVKDLGSGISLKYTNNEILSAVDGLVEMGYKFYSGESYSRLEREGFKITYE